MVDRSDNSLDATAFLWFIGPGCFEKTYAGLGVQIPGSGFSLCAAAHRSERADAIASKVARRDAARRSVAQVIAAGRW